MPMNNRLLRPTTGLDPDAAKYLAAVEAADGEPLEPAVRTAINAFFGDLKSTPGLFDAIKASCILCGARTITGALVPLAGDAPTAQGGWSSGDYSRTAGMTGDGAALYLDSGRANDADPQNDQHLAAYCSSGVVTAGEYLIGATESETISYSLAGYRTYSRSSSAGGSLGGGTGLYAVSRSSASGYSSMQASGSVAFISKESVNVTLSQSILVFGHSTTNGLPAAFTDDSIAFYSIGTSVGGSGLVALDTAVGNLISAIGEAL